MSQSRFLADEDFRGSIVRAVRRLNSSLEVSTVVEKGLSGATDEEVLEYAQAEGWLLLSHDVSTMQGVAEQRIASGLHIHGLFLAPQRHATRSIAESIVLIGSGSEFEEWQDRIVFLPL